VVKCVSWQGENTGLCPDMMEGGDERMLDQVTVWALCVEDRWEIFCENI
jgi:hypothetical protein